VLHGTGSRVSFLSPRLDAVRRPNLEAVRTTFAVHNNDAAIMWQRSPGSGCVDRDGPGPG
jgi:hypothetical protein